LVILFQNLSKPFPNFPNFRGVFWKPHQTRLPEGSELFQNLFQTEKKGGNFSRKKPRKIAKGKSFPAVVWKRIWNSLENLKFHLFFFLRKDFFFPLSDAPCRMLKTKFYLHLIEMALKLVWKVWNRFGKGLEKFRDNSKWC
jgi:hypothetical protein